MLKLTNEIILYHGSYCEVSHPELQKCAKQKDFGQGFYLTSSREQAISFLNTSISKAITKGDITEKQNYGIISKFEIECNQELSVHMFPDADSEWLHCIAAHRKKKCFAELQEKMNSFDVIIGKIADDTTNATLAAYIAGAFGTMGSKEADEFCIRQLLPEKLKDQYCFKTEKALACLQFIGGEKIWLK